MSTTTEPVEEQEAPEVEGSDGDRSTRRMLVVLFVVLGLAVLALLALLIWLLRPEPTTTPGLEAGYPIDVQTTIYGYGQTPDALLRAPLGVAFDGDGNVWVSDTGRSRVEVYTSDGTYIRSIGTDKGAGKLYAPYGLAVDQGRNLVYVADMGAHLLQLYTTDGQYVGHFPADDQNGKVFSPTGFIPYHVELLNGRILVTSADGLYFFDQNGRVVARWGATYKGQNIRGPAPGMFNFPDSFTVDPATGWVYVADTANRRVVAIDPNGFVKWSSGAPDKNGKIRSFWQLPRSIVLGTDGNLYVVDTFRFDQKGMGTGHIVVLSKDGQLLSEFGRAGTDDGSFAYPDQLASGPDGLWAVADRENNRVVVFKLRTPYPPVDDLLARRYPKGFDRPAFTWVTPPPTPPQQGG